MLMEDARALVLAKACDISNAVIKLSYVSMKTNHILTELFLLEAFKKPAPAMLDFQSHEAVSDF